MIIMLSHQESKCTNPLPPASRAVVFSLRDVGVSFGGTWALKNIQLDIKKGEILFISGPSGAGKTTLLRVLSDQIQPTCGSFYNHAEELFISQVFQDLRLLMDMTIRDNLMLSYDNRLYQSRNHFLSDLIELSRVLGLDDKLEMRMSHANGGLKQKVATIRALLARPDIFIADEPTSSLDLQSAEKLFELLGLYNRKRGMGVIWAGHNRELFKSLGGKIITIDKGRILHSGHACFI